MTGPRARMTIDELLSPTRRRLKRLDPVAALDAVAAGAVLVDIRSERQREFMSRADRACRLTVSGNLPS